MSKLIWFLLVIFLVSIGIIIGYFKWYVPYNEADVKDILNKNEIYSDSIEIKNNHIDLLTVKLDSVVSELAVYKTLPEKIHIKYVKEHSIALSADADSTDSILSRNIERYKERFNKDPFK